MKLQAWTTIVVCSLVPWMALAQSPCSTVEMESAFRTQHPEEIPVIEHAQDELAQFTRQYKIQEPYNRNQELLVVPVVVHVIHDNGPENISDAQVINSIQVLNDDFNGLNWDTIMVIPEFQDAIGFANIEFRLATLDPDGNPTNGIERYEDPATHSADNGVKSGRQWPRDMYLNIYVVEDIASGAAGYSYYPSSVAGGNGAQIDGIVILHNYMGQIGTAGGERRTLTHEVGHWLNLPHCWGSTNEPNLASNCNSDDGIGDTPNTIGHTSCDLSAETCNSLDNVQNHMEYSYCSRMFTLEQTLHMRAALESSVAGRSNLWSSGNLGATGTNTLAYVDFGTDNRTICKGEPTLFRDLSQYGGTEFEWIFDGPEQVTSSQRFPVMAFDTPGLYNVSLNVSQGASTLTESKAGYLVVIDTPGEYLPFEESFESTNLATEWISMNLDTLNGWELTTAAAYAGSTSLKMNNFGNPELARDEVLSRAFDLSIMNTAEVSFKWAYAPTDSSNNDRLLVMFSNNCGKDWIIKDGLQGLDLATDTIQTTDWAPTSQSQWQQMTLPITGSYHGPNFRMKFVFISGGGNNLYIDDINLEGTYTTIPELVYPQNGDVLGPDVVVLDWTAVGFVDGYQFQLDTTPDFYSPFMRTSSTTWTSNESDNEDTKYNMSYLPDIWTYYWRVRAIENGFAQPWSETWSFNTDQALSAENVIEAKQTELLLMPNPTADRVTLSFVPKAGEAVNLGVYDLTGREVVPVFSGAQLQGPQTLSVELNGLSAGVYMVRLQQDNTVTLKKLVVK